ncbi:homeobox protein cut-like [Blastomyces dermatitidis ER-3]|uniref:Protein CASP n=2 Tax=Ajellomyces dermatitidis TaxID=5039 RepID=F2TC57_AJEDA|nr:homeobox protein cut-like [Blastomyces dermatitidis ER-3]EEQ89786.2 homeobox protein cut-like [Blastomyces dermatitidis ER-3]EGE80820.1 homeobox protein cut-like protein [Blastomyces dermatitidis ATCC 18188]EQL37972.1 homeobox protein cut-like protein [Blastomyces dermatitidis ATCC 26199]
MMDALVAAESVLDESAPSKAGQVEEPAKSEKQAQEENKFQQAIAVWRGIDLSSLVPKLDTTASDIIAHQRDSLVQRKDLAQKTKDFRRLDDATKLAEYKGLLKSYQTFIDLLTNHGKASSSAFLQLYSALSEAPDPYPLLEASVDSLVVSEDTVPKLNSEIDFLRKSTNRLTSQLEESEKKLEEERSLRRKVEENQDAKIQEVEASWTAVLAEKTSNWEAKEKNYEEKAENHERLLKEIKASYEVNQRLDRADGEDTSRSAATAAELEIVASELEKTSERLAEVEARNEQLSLELAQAVSHSQSENKHRTLEDDPSFLRLQAENSSLLRKLDAARYEKDADKHSWEGKLRQIERQNNKITAERDEIKSKLDKWSDYEDIRRELEAIKSIEFSTADDDDDDKDVMDDTNSTAPNESGKSKESSLEQLLLTRNKKLSNELTILRVSHQDLQNQLEALREDLSKTSADLQKSQNLAATLENDLLQMQREAPSFPSAAMSVAGTYASRYPHSSRRGRAPSPTSSIISGFDHANASANTMEAIRAGEAVGGGSGILPMVQAQRDRFKQKNNELEEELSKTYAIVKSLRQEVASLQKDNLNLYEKTRYVSTYNRGGQSSTSSASAYGNNPKATSIHPSADSASGLSVDRYQSAYEAQISPFAAFRGRESARAYRRMSVPERIIFSVTRMVLANRTSRNLFAGYCVALHILLFVMLYIMSTSEIERQTASAALGSLGGAAMAGSAGVGSSGAGTGNGAGGSPASGDWQQDKFNNPAY